MESEAKQDIQLSPKAKIEAEGVPLARPLVEMERVFERLMGQRWPFPQGWANPLEWRQPWWNDLFEMTGLRTPSIDVVDRDDEIVVRAEVPGVDKKGLELSIVDHVLSIKGESCAETKEEKGDYHCHEITRSGFSRTVTLPTAVDSTKVTAVLKNGILEVSLPKLESSKRHNISIREEK